MDIHTAFADAIQAAGITPPPDIQADGALHRFSADGRPGDTAGYYILHPDGVPAGCFGDWRQGIEQTWRADLGRPLSTEEHRQARARAAAMRAQRQQAEADGHELASHQAKAMWERARPAPADHPYLRRKAIEAHGARVRGDGWLLVPMTDLTGKLWNLEQIAPTPPATGPAKKGLFRGRRAGLLYLLGDRHDASHLLIGEGFATCATLHEATGLPVACAFSAGNLESVAKALAADQPMTQLILCADDDVATPGNPGLTKAKAAALAVGGLVAVPDFGADRLAGASDFNDLAQARGQEVVAEQIAALVTVIPEAETPTDPPLGADPATAEGTLFPDLADRPAFIVVDDWMVDGKRKIRPGTYYCYAARTKDEGDVPVNLRFAGPLHIEAVTHDGAGFNFGRLLRFKSCLNKWREWAMPMALLAGSGEEMRASLLDMGLELDPEGARRYLANYLQHRVPPRRLTCATKAGWLGDSFVLPDNSVYGPSANTITFQSAEIGRDEYAQAGTLAGWQEHIAALAPGNVLLTVAISLAFSGPLLHKCNLDGGGLLLVADSSTGKTSLERGATSVWGGKEFGRSWRATASGLEGAAATYNDNLLSLDEISECDPREIGAIVYSLANGTGKQRANRSGSARSVTRWRCAILSTGERTLATAMEEGGKRPKAGQEVRLMSIPATRTYGCWDDLKGFESGAALSDALKAAATQHHGTAGRAFLERLTRDPTDFRAALSKLVAAQFTFPGAAGQEKRAASRFAVIALAGELATQYGITGWPPGSAIAAAREAFDLWRGFRGQGGNSEIAQIRDQVAAFIDRHGDARFSNADLSDTQAGLLVRDRAGWWRDSANGREFLFTAQGMREALHGFDYKRGLAVLEELGALLPSGSSERSKAVRLGGRPVKVYGLDPARLGGDSHVAG